jgi:hypothetical protein
MVRMVVHAERLANDGGNPAGGPELGGVAVGQRPSHRHFQEPPLFGRPQLRGPAGRRAHNQASRPLSADSIPPPHHRTGRTAKFPADVVQRQPVGQQSESPAPPRFENHHRHPQPLEDPKSRAACATLVKALQDAGNDAVLTLYGGAQRGFDEVPGNSAPTTAGKAIPRPANPSPAGPTRDKAPNVSATRGETVGFAPDPSVPITEYNRPRPGTLHSRTIPVIFEAAFRHAG